MLQPSQNAIFVRGTFRSNNGQRCNNARSMYILLLLLLLSSMRFVYLLLLFVIAMK